MNAICAGLHRLTILSIKVSMTAATSAESTKLLGFGSHISFSIVVVFSLVAAEASTIALERRLFVLLLMMMMVLIIADWS
jgi:hypothetical protein